MRSIALNIILLLTFQTIGQEELRENLWYSLSMKQSIKKQFELAFDVGYRSCDRFVDQHRTVLGRLIIEKRINVKHFAGVGFALFDHFNGTWNLEKRPFLQYQFKSSIGKMNYGIRFRNEFRFFAINDVFANRSRLQLATRYSGIHRWLEPGLSAEAFFTPGSQLSYEERYTASVFSKVSDFLVTHIFYTLQRQSAYDVIQHIIGFQLQFTIHGSNKE